MPNTINYEKLLQYYFELKSNLEILKSNLENLKLSFDKEESENRKIKNKILEIETRTDDLKKDIQKLFDNDAIQVENFTKFSNKIYDEIKNTEVTFKVNKNILGLGILTTITLLLFYSDKFVDFLSKDLILKIIAFIIGV